MINMFSAKWQVLKKNNKPTTNISSLSTYQQQTGIERDVLSGNSPLRGVKDLCKKQNKTKQTLKSLRRLRKTLKDWRDRLYPQTDRMNTVKMTILSKATYRFNAIRIKIPMTLLIKIENKTLKFIQIHKRYQIAKAISSKKNNAGEQY